jgi:nicotinamidase-related amidase
MGNNTALLIIDMQNDVVKKLPLASSIIPGIRTILDRFRADGRPVFHIRRSYRADGSDVELPRLEQFKAHGFKVVGGTPGAEIVDELKPIENEHIITKPRWSGFCRTSLDLLLNRLAIKTLVITGVQTPNCIRTTAYDAIAYDFDTIVISDCTAAASDEVHQYNLDDMANIGVKIQKKAEFFKDYE